MIVNSPYNDIILYCKGWYYKNNNLYEDLGYLFSKIYGWVPKEESELAPMMLRVLDKINTERERKITLYDFYNEVQRRINIYEVSENRAIILYVRAELQGLSMDEIKLNAPHYGKKEYFRMGTLFGEIPPISMTYTEMNRRAQKMFT